MAAPSPGAAFGKTSLPARLNPSPSAKADVKGGSGGKVPKAPAPPGAAQRKYIFGLGGPQGPRCHMKPKAE